MNDLSGRAIVITGASSGIGAATAMACAEAGMNVVLGARRPDRLESIAERVRATGVEAGIVVGDVADPDNVSDLLDEADRLFGGADAVFANAGYGTEKAFTAMSDEDFRRMFEVNFFASVALCREAALRWLDRGRGGHLLICSSCLAKFTLPYYGVYAATKSAQAMVARSMRYELAPHGIEVSSVHPVTTRTEFFEVSSELSGVDAGGSTVPDHAPKAFVQPPERVARAVVSCLRSPRSEVWTSLITRFASALFTFLPGLQDLVMRRQAGRDASLHDPRPPVG